MTEILEFLKQLPLTKVITVAVLIIVSAVTVKILLEILEKSLNRSKLDELARRVLRTIIKAFLLCIATIIILSSIGIPVTSLIAALSVIGVAFSLAIQDFLSNVFGGIQLISNHPFKVGDYVEAGGQAGTVRDVVLFYTKLDTPDKKLVQIPNSKIANDSIVNYSHAPTRRVDFSVCVSYDGEVEKVKEVLLKLLSEHPMVIKDNADMAPAVHVKEYRDNDICYTARVWCENANYWTVYFDIMDALKPTVESNGLEFSFPHVNVHMIKE